jgi:hypothetical protein
VKTRSNTLPAGPTPDPRSSTESSSAILPEDLIHRLQEGRAALDRTRELGEHAVARRVHQAQRAFLVGLHEPRVAGAVGGQDRGQLPLDRRAHVILLTLRSSESAMEGEPRLKGENMNKRWMTIAALAIVMVSAGCVVEAPAPPPPPVATAPPEIVVPSYPAPPPPQAEVVVVRPGPAHVWIAGHWSWQPARGAYVWAPGRWVVPASPRHVWVPGHWQRRPGGYVWVDGHWKH